jgi:hypothetical protein
MNFVGFHCYTGGAERYAPYVEPFIRIRYRDVEPEAGLDTSLTARWGYRPLAVKDFAFETGKLFKLRRGANAFGADAATTARSNAERYAKAQELMRSVLGLAHQRGLQVAIGFEFGVHPPELASIVPPESRIPGALLPDPMHPANIEILRSALGNILDTYPSVDWIWLWLHEHTMFISQPRLEGDFRKFYETNHQYFGGAERDQNVFTGVWSLAYINQVREYLHRRSPATRLVIGGWGGGPQLPPILRGLDRSLPKEVVFSCLNPNMGATPFVPVLKEIARNREVWSMPWLEGDGSLWHLQLRAAATHEQVRAGQEAGLRGAVAIHWRTEEIRPNFEAFSRAVAAPMVAASAEELYLDHCRKRYGEAAAAPLASLFTKLEVDGKLGNLRSPEFFPYDPSWGRLDSALNRDIQEAVGLIEKLRRDASDKEAKELGWLGDNFRFTLLLDDVGRKLEPAYLLKEAWLRQDTNEWDSRVAAARDALLRAPIQELLEVFARRVRSRGELGELSALNQKLWLQYLELRAFLEKHNPLPPLKKK